MRTRHARFYERPRDPEDYIDMSSMLLQSPTFDDECRTNCWRCQLWPNILWPRVEVDRLGNKPDDEFEKASELERKLDSNITYDWEH